MENHHWLKAQGPQTQLFLYIQPGASKSEVTGTFGDPARLKMRIKSPPRDGEANAEVREFIAKLLGISKTKVEFIRGESSRQKDLLVDLPSNEVLILLLKLL